MSTYDEYRVALDAREEGDERRAQQILDQIDQVAYVRASWKRTLPGKPRFVVGDAGIDDEHDLQLELEGERPMDADEMREERRRVRRQWAQIDWQRWLTGPTQHDAMLCDIYRADAIGGLVYRDSPFFGIIRTVADPNVPRDRAYLVQPMAHDPVRHHVVMNPTTFAALERFGRPPRYRMPNLRESLAAALARSESDE